MHLILFGTKINHVRSALIFARVLQRICMLKRNGYEYLIDYMLMKKQK